MSQFRFFVTARHWQVFLLLTGSFVLAQALGQSLVMGSVGSQAQFQEAMGSFLLLTFLVMALYLSWLWALGRLAWALAPSHGRPAMSRFRFSLIYPIAYLPVFYFLFTKAAEPSGIAVVIIPLHLLAMSCMFYNLYFVAKSLALAEGRRADSFYDYAGAFFLLWFYPIGIWILQPRFNALAAMPPTQRS
jgi:hypothetical protein